MNTDKEQTKGKTIFIEYSEANPGQHFITVLQTMPDTQRKVLIARITKEDKGGELVYNAQSPNGHQVLPVTTNLDTIKKELVGKGHALALKELEQEQLKQRSNPKKETEVPAENTQPKQEPAKEKPKARTAQLKTIRAQKGGKGKTITR